MGIKLPKGAVARERELSLIERVERIERKLGLSLSSVQENIQEPVSNNNTGSEDKESLIAKLLALKESNPKAVKASPSAIPNMSVEKLTTLIAEAEATIAAGNQE